MVKKPNPIEIPSKIDHNLWFRLIIFIVNKRHNDQKNNKGVSVEIIKLPKLVKGKNIHIKAA